MPANRKPTALLKANGAFKKDPQRYRDRADEPKGKGKLRKYPDLDPDLSEIWSDLAAQLAPGVATGSDRSSFHSMVMLRGKELTGTITTGERALLFKLYGDFGMTPRGRSYVKGDPDHGQKDDNPFSD